MRPEVVKEEEIINNLESEKKNEEDSLYHQSGKNQTSRYS
jgi:hypothetical protein